MPNWVENTLQVKNGDPKEVFEFLRSEKLLVDFNKVVPMPADIRALVDAQTPALVMQDGTKCYEWPIRDAWNRDHWGTKWNARDATYSIKDPEHALCFFTAWSEPLPVFHALARHFPDHKIVIRSNEEVGRFNAVFTLQSGEVKQKADRNGKPPRRVPLAFDDPQRISYLTGSRMLVPVFGPEGMVLSGMSTLTVK